MSSLPKTTATNFDDLWPADAEARKRLVLAGAGLALIVYAYGIARTCLVGGTIAPSVSLFSWLMQFWSRGQDYAHGYVVPIVAGGIFIWKWRTRLPELPLGSSRWGLGLIVTAVLLYWLGVRGTVPRLLATSLVVLIYGLILYLAGWAWAKELWFPCLFLFFMIPLNFLDPYLAFPLRMFVATLASQVLNLLGVGVYQNGTGIFSVSGRFAPLEVADPCSGIRSLVALMALTSLYGYLTMDRSWKKWVLFIASIPLAVLGNLARITAVALVAQGFGQKWATTIYHDYSGYIVFSLAITCMIALGAGLNLHYQEIVYHWTKEEVSRRRPPPKPVDDKAKPKRPVDRKKP